MSDLVKKATTSELLRAAIYVDGFNLYHAIRGTGRPYLKWCNLRRLGEIIIPSRDEKIVRTVFCTAYYPGDNQKRIRHERYNQALKNVGVEIVNGHYVHADFDCPECKFSESRPSEKETDINIALQMFNDARLDVYDHAYLITADSDQAATFRMIRELFPEKIITTVAPPGRNFSKSVLNYSSHKIKLNEAHLEKAVFPKLVPGKKAALRPFEYDPPADWVHPDDRPR